MKDSTKQSPPPYLVSIDKNAAVPVDPIDCESQNVKLHHVRGNQYVLHTGGRTRQVLIEPEDRKNIAISCNNKRFSATVLDHRDQLMAQWGLDENKGQSDLTVFSPMPGLVLSVAVDVGQRVAVGAPLLVLEAMKMENEIKATSEGTVAGISVKPGDAVQKGHILIEFSPSQS